MAKRYRDFKRVALTAKTAALMVDQLVDKTFEDHFSMGKCYSCQRSWNVGLCGDCLGRGQVPKCPDREDCIHVENGNLAVARLVEAGMHIGVKRAHLDIPDDPETVKLFVDRLLDFAQDAKGVQRVGAAPVFKKTAEIARRWANRSPLERLAEAGLELD